MKLKNKDEFKAEAALRILTAAIQAKAMVGGPTMDEAYKANAVAAALLADHLIEALES